LTRTVLKKSFAIIGILMVLPLSGCKVFSDSLVIHDELFTYNIQYDKGYMMVVEAVNETNDWRLAGVDKRKGTVSAYSEKFMSDDRVVIIVKKIDETKMSVELAPDSQQVRGVEVLLKQIDKKFMP
jgi:hypothetical protein